jgi:hypothetical protein
MTSSPTQKQPVNLSGLVADLIGHAAVLSDRPEKWTATLFLLKQHGIDPQGFEDFEAGRRAAITAAFACYGVPPSVVKEADAKEEDICGLCGQPGADKLAHSDYWPGERRPDGPMVHSECEREECGRAHAALTPQQRDAFLFPGRR